MYRGSTSVRGYRRTRCWSDGSAPEQRWPPIVLGFSIPRLILGAERMSSQTLIRCERIIDAAPAAVFQVLEDLAAARLADHALVQPLKERYTTFKAVPAGRPRTGRRSYGGGRIAASVRHRRSSSIWVPMWTVAASGKAAHAHCTRKDRAHDRRLADLHEARRDVLASASLPRSRSERVLCLSIRARPKFLSTRSLWVSAGRGRMASAQAIRPDARERKPTQDAASDCSARRDPDEVFYVLDGG